MTLSTYKLLAYPLSFFKFFKYGIPYCYLIRNRDENTKKEYYTLAWYFNNNGIRENNIKNKKYNSSRFLGYSKSLYYSYKKIL